MAGPALSFDNGQPDAQRRIYTTNAGIFPYEFPSFLSHRSLCQVPKWMSVLWICVTASWDLVLFTIPFGKKLLHLNSNSVEKHLSLFWLCLLISILCSSFSVSISYSPFLYHFLQESCPLISYSRKWNIYTHIMCEPLHVQWRRWYGASEGLSSRDFFSTGLRWLLSWRQNSRMSSCLPQLQGEWAVRSAEQCRSHPGSLSARERGAGMREHNMGAMHPAHFRRPHKSVESPCK